jgi:hypothetical protein
LNTPDTDTGTEPPVALTVAASRIVASQLRQRMTGRTTTESMAARCWRIR